MHALIIEDQFLIAALVEEELRELGYTSFDVVASEDEAIEAADKRCPLITADDRLTRGSGVNAVREICSRYDIPVVFSADNPAKIREVVSDAVAISSLLSGDIARSYWRSGDKNEPQEKVANNSTPLREFLYPRCF